MDQWAPLAAGRSPRTYAPGQMIYLQGTQADQFYYILSGTVKCFLSSAEGDERTLTLHRSGDLIGEAAFFDRHYDYVIDAIDLVSCKLSLIVNARALGIPIISAMGTGNKLDPTQFCITDIAKTSGCHLARIMRRELKARGIFHHTVLFSEELPRKPLELETPPPGRRTIPASVSWTPSCAGLMLAGYVVQELLREE